MLLDEHSLPVGLLFGIILSVGRNRSPVGNNVVIRKVVCRRSLFTRSFGLVSINSMSCTRRAILSSVFNEQRKRPGKHGSVRSSPSLSRARAVASTSTRRCGHVEGCIGMPTIPQRAARASAILDRPREFRSPVWRRLHRLSHASQHSPRWPIRTRSRQPNRR